MSATPRSPDSRLVAPGAGPRLRTENAPEVRVDPTVHGVPVAVLEHEVAPRTLGTPHVHENEDQVAYVLEGTIGFRVGGDELVAGPGSLVVRPRGVVHALWNPTDEPARMLEISIPGTVLGYFQAVDAALRGEPAAREAALAAARRGSGVVERLDLVDELAKRHGVHREEGAQL